MSYSTLPLASKLFQLTFLTCALALAGCGGGDTVDVITPAPGTGGNTGGGSGTGTPASKVNITTLSLKDTNGNLTRTISSEGAVASVTVTDAQGQPISSALVTFEGSGVKFGTSNGSVLTNEKGEASTSVKPLDNTDTGSYQVKATVIENGLTATTPSYNFTLQSVNIVLENIMLSSYNLVSGGNASITLKTKDTVNSLYKNDSTVNFTASCGTFDNNNVVSSNQGDVATTYKAIDENGNLCEGQQTITATPINSQSNKQAVTINIANVQASSVVYTTTNKVQLGANNSGSSSSGQIEFTIFANGRPAANQQVEISKVYAPADFSFVTLNNQSPQIVITDGQGQVMINLYPGALPGPVEIKATLKSNANIFALSKDVSVATGRATQNGFSVSITKNVLANERDGDVSTIKVSLVDRTGNPVPNGTVVSFVSEGGRVSPNCTTKDGICSVEFSTQNPYPADNRVTVIAYVEGDKAYTDIDGDNMFGVGDILTQNIGDFFRDDNENNQYDANLGEFVYRKGASGALCAPSSVYQPNIAGTCDNGLAATLRYQFVLGLASSTPVFEALPDTLPAKSGTRYFQMFGNSMQSVSMASGTTISATAEGSSCKAEFVSGYETVPNTVPLSNKEAFEKAVRYGFSYSDCSAGDKIKVTVTTPAPSATTTTKNIDII